MLSPIHSTAALLLCGLLLVASNVAAAKKRAAVSFRPWFRNLLEQEQRQRRRHLQPATDDEASFFVKWCQTELSRYENEQTQQGWPSEAVETLQIEYPIPTILSLHKTLTQCSALLPSSSTTTGNTEEEMFGVNGEYTDYLQQQSRQNQAFWTSTTTTSTSGSTQNNWCLIGLHGRDIQDRNELYAALQWVVEPETNATDLENAVTEIHNAIAVIPGTFDNPLLTLTAISLSNQQMDLEQTNRGLWPPIRGTAVIGDGMLEFIHQANLVNTTTTTTTTNDDDELLPQAFIVSHEYIHDLQMELGSYQRDRSPRENRDLELVADAAAAYFLVHSMGGKGTIDRKSQVEVMAKTAAHFGDFATETAGHHGTPQQRECAVVWGASLGRRDGVGNTTMTIEEFDALFEDRLADILTADPTGTTCPNVTVDPEVCVTSAAYILSGFVSYSLALAIGAFVIIY